MRILHPLSDAGQVQAEVERLRSELYRKVEGHELSTTNHRVVDLERAVGEIRALVDELRSWLKRLEENQVNDE